jgi:hypothetical protein
VVVLELIPTETGIINGEVIIDLSLMSEILI